MSSLISEKQLSSEPLLFTGALFNWFLSSLSGFLSFPLALLVTSTTLRSSPATTYKWSPIFTSSLSLSFSHHHLLVRIVHLNAPWIPQPSVYYTTFLSEADSLSSFPNFCLCTQLFFFPFIGVISECCPSLSYFLLQSYATSFHWNLKRELKMTMCCLVC